MILLTPPGRLRLSTINARATERALVSDEQGKPRTNEGVEG